MTEDQFRKALRQIERELKLRAEKEAEIRRRWREERDLIYVKSYTVQAHLRVRKRRRRLRAVA